MDRQYRAPVESGLEVLDLGGGCQVCNAADRGVAGEHFADNDIDVSVLPYLPDADLEKIGVSRPRLRSRGDPSERVATRTNRASQNELDAGYDPTRVAFLFARPPRQSRAASQGRGNVPLSCLRRDKVRTVCSLDFGGLMTDSIAIEKPADIVPAVVDGIRHFIGWLERRRANELYINETTGDIEITAEEMNKMIAGFKRWAEALEITGQERDDDGERQGVESTAA